LAALKAFAHQEGVAVSEYARRMVHDHILERGAEFSQAGVRFSQGDVRLKAMIMAIKAWLIAYYQSVAIAGQLPGKERRAELERLTWEAVKKAHEFIQTEEAAKNAKHRILAIQAIALITRAEEQILADMDKGEVGQIVERIEAVLNVMDKTAEPTTRKTAGGK
jgi:hypothetical protein